MAESPGSTSSSTASPVEASGSASSRGSGLDCAARLHRGRRPGHLMAGKGACRTVFFGPAPAPPSHRCSTRGKHGRHLLRTARPGEDPALGITAGVPAAGPDHPDEQNNGGTAQPRRTAPWKVLADLESAMLDRLGSENAGRRPVGLSPASCLGDAGHGHPPCLANPRAPTWSASLLLRKPRGSAVRLNARAR